MNEQEVIAKLEAWRKEGSDSRDNGKPCPYPGNSLAHYMHSDGWLRRDLQIALCLAKPGYHKSQMHDHFLAALAPTATPPWMDQ